MVIIAFCNYNIVFSQIFSGRYDSTKNVWTESAFLAELNHTTFKISSNNFRARISGIELAIGRCIIINTSDKFNINFALKVGFRHKNFRNDYNRKSISFSSVPDPYLVMYYSELYDSLSLDDNNNHLFVELPLFCQYVIFNNYKLNIGFNFIYYLVNNNTSRRQNFIAGKGSAELFLGLSKSVSRKLNLSLNYQKGINDIYSLHTITNTTSGDVVDLITHIKRSSLQLTAYYHLK